MKNTDRIPTKLPKLEQTVRISENVERDTPTKKKSRCKLLSRNIKSLPAIPHILDEEIKLSRMVTHSKTKSLFNLESIAFKSLLKKNKIPNIAKFEELSTPLSKQLEKNEAHRSHLIGSVSKGDSSILLKLLDKVKMKQEVNKTSRKEKETVMKKNFVEDVPTPDSHEVELEEDSFDIETASYANALLCELSSTRKQRAKDNLMRELNEIYARVEQALNYYGYEEYPPDDDVDMEAGSITSIVTARMSDKRSKLKQRKILNMIVHKSLQDAYLRLTALQDLHRWIRNEKVDLKDYDISDDQMEENDVDVNETHRYIMKSLNTFTNCSDGISMIGEKLLTLIAKLTESYSHIPRMRICDEETLICSPTAWESAVARLLFLFKESLQWVQQEPMKSALFNGMKQYEIVMRVCDLKFKEEDLYGHQALTNEMEYTETNQQLNKKNVEVKYLQDVISEKEKEKQNMQLHQKQANEMTRRLTAQVTKLEEKHGKGMKKASERKIATSPRSSRLSVVKTGKVTMDKIKVDLSSLDQMKSLQMESVEVKVIADNLKAQIKGLEQNLAKERNMVFRLKETCKKRGIKYLDLLGEEDVKTTKISKPPIPNDKKDRQVSSGTPRIKLDRTKGEHISGASPTPTPSTTPDLTKGGHVSSASPSHKLGIPPDHTKGGHVSSTPPSPSPSTKDGYVSSASPTHTPGITRDHTKGRPVSRASASTTPDHTEDGHVKSLSPTNIPRITPDHTKDGYVSSTPSSPVPSITPDDTKDEHVSSASLSPKPGITPDDAKDEHVSSVSQSLKPGITPDHTEDGYVSSTSPSPKPGIALLHSDGQLSSASLTHTARIALDQSKDWQISSVSQDAVFLSSSVSSTAPTAPLDDTKGGHVSMGSAELPLSASSAVSSTPTPSISLEATHTAKPQIHPSSKTFDVNSEVTSLEDASKLLGDPTLNVEADDSSRILPKITTAHTKRDESMDILRIAPEKLFKDSDKLPSMKMLKPKTDSSSDFLTEGKTWKTGISDADDIVTTKKHLDGLKHGYKNMSEAVLHCRDTMARNLRKEGFKKSAREILMQDREVTKSAHPSQDPEKKSSTPNPIECVKRIEDVTINLLNAVHVITQAAEEKVEDNHEGTEMRSSDDFAKELEKKKNYLDTTNADLDRLNDNYKYLMKMFTDQRREMENLKKQIGNDVEMKDTHADVKSDDDVEDFEPIVQVVESSRKQMKLGTVSFTKLEHGDHHDIEFPFTIIHKRRNLELIEKGYDQKKIPKRIYEVSKKMILDPFVLEDIHLRSVLVEYFIGLAPDRDGIAQKDYARQLSVIQYLDKMHQRLKKRDTTIIQEILKLQNKEKPIYVGIWSLFDAMLLNKGIQLHLPMLQEEKQNRMPPPVIKQKDTCILGAELPICDNSTLKKNRNLPSQLKDDNLSKEDFPTFGEVSSGHLTTTKRKTVIPLTKKKNTIDLNIQISGLNLARKEKSISPQASEESVSYSDLSSDRVIKPYHLLSTRDKNRRLFPLNKCSGFNIMNSKVHYIGELLPPTKKRNT